MHQVPSLPNTLGMFNNGKRSKTVMKPRTCHLRALMKESSHNADTVNREATHKPRIR
jgi:hypothetical protein